MFNYARERSLLAGVNQVDYELLRTIVGMVSGYEVSIYTARDWERVIIQTYTIWRKVVRAGEGVIILDLDKRAIGIIHST